MNESFCVTGGKLISSQFFKLISPSRKRSLIQRFCTIGDQDIHWCVSSTGNMHLCVRYKTCLFRPFGLFGERRRRQAFYVFLFWWVAWVASLFPFQALFKERYETMSVENQQACRLRFQKLRERLLVSIGGSRTLDIFQMSWLVCRLLWGLFSWWRLTQQKQFANKVSG